MFRNKDLVCYKYGVMVHEMIMQDDGRTPPMVSLQSESYNFSVLKLSLLHLLVIENLKSTTELCPISSGFSLKQRTNA